MIKKIIGISLLGISTFSAQASISDIAFGYGSLKDSDLGNPSLTRLFENYISAIEQKDMNYTKTIRNYERTYNEEVSKAKKKFIYKKEEDQALIINNLRLKEKGKYLNVTKSFYDDELSLFNSFVKGIKSDRRMSNDEKKVALNSLSGIHEKFNYFEQTFKATIEPTITTCFNNNKNISVIIYNNQLDYCNNFYTNFNNSFSKIFKQYVNNDFKSFVTKYKVAAEQVKLKNDLDESINNIKRNR